MNFVTKQFYQNSLTLFIGFAIGALNTLYLFVHFLDEKNYGLIVFLLSSALLIMPVIVLGLHNTVIKFYFTYHSESEKNRFLSFTLLLPLLFYLPVIGLSSMYYDEVLNLIFGNREELKRYAFLIVIIAFFIGYFELFYAWTKVKMKTTYGNFLKEVFIRVGIALLLIAMYINLISVPQLIYGIAILYGTRLLLMAIYAIKLHQFSLKIKFPKHKRALLHYSGYMILAGSISGVMLEIDKTMIPLFEDLSENAYYAVGAYIASVIIIPLRSVQHIVIPVIAKAMNRDRIRVVEKLYKQVSFNILLVGGLIFLLINSNGAEIYQVIGKPEYAKGIIIVLLLSSVRIIEIIFGIGNGILSNSTYYKQFFIFSLSMALCLIFLNRTLVALLGIKGIAIATLIVMFVFTGIKIYFIYQKIKIHPFHRKTLKLIALILGLFMVGSQLQFPSFHFIRSIILESLIITFLYVLLLKKLKIIKSFKQIANL